MTRILTGIPEWGDLSQRTLAAKALWFYADWEHNAGVLRLRASQADDSTADKINATKTIPPFKRLAPGIWQSIVPLAFEDRDPDPAFGVAWLFGFGAVI